MPAFIHERAEHILAKNPSMPKSEAFGIATQQSHALGKSPKGYGTAKGRATAKAKYRTPGNDKKTANPGHLKSPKMEKKSSIISAFSDELGEIVKAAGIWDTLIKDIPGTKPWIIGNVQTASRLAKPAGTATTAAKAAIKPKLRTGQLSSGAWDVSRQAKEMGL